MTGAAMALAANSNATSPPPPPPPPQVSVSAPGITGDVAGASGFLTAMEARATSPGNPQSQYTWSNAKVSGSTKITLNSTTAPTTTAGYMFTFAYTGLAVGEQCVVSWDVFADLSGYVGGSARFLINITRTS